MLTPSIVPGCLQYWQDQKDSSGDQERSYARYSLLHED